VEGGEKLTTDPKLDRETTILLAQYQQVCEDLRQLDSLVWRIIPPLVALIGGSLVVVVFSVMTDAALPARELVLGIALILMVGMSCILLRHRYFQAIAVGTLSELEKELQVKHIQRIPFPKKFDDRHPESAIYPNGLLYETKPEWRDGTPGPKLLFLFMLIISFSIIILMIYVITQPGTITPSCCDKTWAWVIFGLFVLSAIMIPCCLKLRENRKIKAELKRNE
jgi:hypothetical protein